MSHDRTLDHFGTEDTTTTVLSDAIGRYPEGMSLQDVLADMIARLVALETNPVEGAQFRANAVLLGYHFFADAIVHRTITTVGGLPLQIHTNAVIEDGIYFGSFTANAVKRSTAGTGQSGSFTLDGLLINEIDCV